MLNGSLARCEVVASLYGGSASTGHTDVRLETERSEVTFENVGWSGESFESPVYYGLRVTWWRGEGTGWGVFGDITHAKMLGRLDESVTVRGRRDGRPVGGRERLGKTFGELGLSHGHNLLTAGGAWRWLPKGSRDGSFLGRLRPHVLAGAGAALPHVEVEADGAKTADYQLAGPALVAGGGVSFDVAGPVSLLAEYRISWADVSADLSEGGSLELRPWTSHFTLGLSVAF